MSNIKGFEELRRRIIKCERCPRLLEYAVAAELKKPARFAHWAYWGKPVPGFGDQNARLLVIGLAPATAGALRTGRIFTGDASSRFLVKALHSVGFANKAISESRDDGLVYTDCYLTAAVKCAPPGDRPTPEEFENCSSYLEAEILMLRNLKAVLVLGSLAFRSYLIHLGKSGVPTKGAKFEHGKKYHFGAGPILFASYHPSPRNTNTGRLSTEMLVDVLGRIRREIGSGSESRI